MFREIARISIISRSHIFPSKALDIFLISGFIALDFFVVNRLPLTWPICFCLAGGRNWLSRWTILIPSEIRWCRSVTSFSDCWNAMRIFSRVSSSWNTVMASNTDWIRLSIDFLPVWAISYFRFFIFAIFFDIFYLPVQSLGGSGYSGIAVYFSHAVPPQFISNLTIVIFIQIL